jgi:hypothetical protein
MAEFFLSSNGADLVDVVRAILCQSDEPLTVQKIHGRLPASFRSMPIEDLGEVLRRQVAAHVLIICPKYRSAQDRYWDRPLREHAKVLLHAALREGPAAWSDLRKRLPKYLRHLAESVLSEELARGTIFRHPPTSVRMGPRYALQPAEVRSYASKCVLDSLHHLQALGFARHEAREAMMQLLQEEEWSEYQSPDPRATENCMPARTDLWNTPMF